MSGPRLTRGGVYALTAISAALFVLLCWIFADGLLIGAVWNAESWVDSPLITWLLLLVIIAIGAMQASRMPDAGVPLTLPRDRVTPGQTDDPRLWQLLMGNALFSLFWVPLRFFVGREWLSAGLHKTASPAWTDGGAALKGFWSGAAAVPESGAPPVTYDWFRNFLQYMLDHGWYTWFGPLVAWGEVLVGIGLLVGGLVGLAAFFGTLMNFSFGLAGSASTNPVLFGLSVFLVLAWRVAGFWGLDRYILPLFGIRPNAWGASGAETAAASPPMGRQSSHPRA
ncbi:MAG: DoxX family protein [Thermomicrobiales bacterium]|nr:DoxX family protein [Thermomicrobiales bacterium]